MKTTLHSDIGEFITQLSNQDAPFLKADAYVRFGDLIVAVRDAIERHRERYCGRTGVVVKAVKSTNTVWIEFPDGDRYGAYPENVRPA